LYGQLVCYQLSDVDIRVAYRGSNKEDYAWIGHRLTICQISVRGSHNELNYCQNQCCGFGMFITDPRSGFFPIPDPGTQIWIPDPTETEEVKLIVKIC